MTTKTKTMKRFEITFTDSEGTIQARREYNSSHHANAFFQALVHSLSKPGQVVLFTDRLLPIASLRGRVEIDRSTKSARTFVGPAFIAVR